MYLVVSAIIGLRKDKNGDKQMNEYLWCKKHNIGKVFLVGSGHRSGYCEQCRKELSELMREHIAHLTPRIPDLGQAVELDDKGIEKK